MIKSTNEFKLEVVGFYLSLEYGYQATANKFGLSGSTVRKRVKTCHSHGLKDISAGTNPNQYIRLNSKCRLSILMN
ncbi:transposase [Neisseria musculi]|uniref:transposase n=1 Tax=Neisseria musculi TaxID=1815583 RepID=UPI00164BE32C|nr:transposase [Neisseria musculi]